MDTETMARNYEEEYNTLATALVGQTGASAILEADRHRKILSGLKQIKKLALDATTDDDKETALNAIYEICENALA